MLSRTVLLIIEFSSEQFSLLWQINTEEKDTGSSNECWFRPSYNLKLLTSSSSSHAPCHTPERERKLEVSKHADRRNELARKVVAKGYKQDDARQEGKLVHSTYKYTIQKTEINASRL